MDAGTAYNGSKLEAGPFIRGLHNSKHNPANATIDRSNAVGHDGCGISGPRTQAYAAQPNPTADAIQHEGRVDGSPGSQSPHQTLPAALQPTHFVVRLGTSDTSRATLVPMIPVDLLPDHIKIVGLPRQLLPDQAAEMINLGTVPKPTERAVYKVEGAYQPWMIGLPAFGQGTPEPQQPRPTENPIGKLPIRGGGDGGALDTHKSGPANKNGRAKIQSLVDREDVSSASTGTDSGMSVSNRRIRSSKKKTGGIGTSTGGATATHTTTINATTPATTKPNATATGFPDDETDADRPTPEVERLIACAVAACEEEEREKEAMKNKYKGKGVMRGQQSGGGGAGNASSSSSGMPTHFYCRHWCHHGSCKWGHQCRYQHVMPTTIEGLQSVGMKEWPVWFRTVVRFTIEGRLNGGGINMGMPMGMPPMDMTMAALYGHGGPNGQGSSHGRPGGAAAGATEKEKKRREKEKEREREEREKERAEKERKKTEERSKGKEREKEADERLERQRDRGRAAILASKARAMGRDFAQAHASAGPAMAAAQEAAVRESQGRTASAPVRGGQANEAEKQDEEENLVEL